MFKSISYPVGKIIFPKFTNTRIMMMPFMLHDINTIPQSLAHYVLTIKQLLKMIPDHVESYNDTPAYLTIDERFVPINTIQRNPGLHIDGMYQGTTAGPWSGSNPGSWGSCGNGMLIASNIDNTVNIYNGNVQGYPINDGDCEHLRNQLSNLVRYSPLAGEVIWADGFNIHESLPVKEDCNRQFIRISLPNDGVWFEDYTPNPLGVQPKGVILPPRIASQAKLYNKEQ